MTLADSFEEIGVGAAAKDRATSGVSTHAESVDGTPSEDVLRQPGIAKMAIRDDSGIESFAGGAKMKPARISV